MEDLLYRLHDDGDIDDEELLLLMPRHRKNLHVGLPYSMYDQCNICEMREDDFEVEFRCKKEDIFRLAAACQLLTTLKCENGVVVDNGEGLCIVLKRLPIHVDMLI